MSLIRGHVESVDRPQDSRLTLAMAERNRASSTPKPRPSALIHKPTLHQW